GDVTPDLGVVEAFDQSGKRLWRRTVENATIDQLVVTADGSLYASGLSGQTVNLDGTPTEGLTGSLYPNILLKIDAATRKIVWTRNTLINDGPEPYIHLAVHEDGVLLSATINDPSVDDRPADTGVSYLAGEALQGSWLVRLDANGELDWRRQVQPTSGRFLG